MAVDLSPLARAIARLAEAITRQADEADDAQLRDGLIQRFEFTYDLSHRTLRRVVEESSANPADVDRLSFPALIRTAVEQGLVAGEWPAWRTYREMRNITSHTYDEGLALRVVAEIPAFLAEAQAMLRLLESRA